MPQMNPDGTVQVAPPTQSAFGPASASAPPPPMAPAAQVSSSPSPGIAGAIQALIASLASAFAPKAVTQAKQRNDAREQEALGDSLAPK